jgi:hypothetical protein
VTTLIDSARAVTLTWDDTTARAGSEIVKNVSMRIPAASFAGLLIVVSPPASAAKISSDFKVPQDRPDGLWRRQD